MNLGSNWKRMQGIANAKCLGIDKPKDYYGRYWGKNTSNGTQLKVNSISLVKRDNSILY